MYDDASAYPKPLKDLLFDGGVRQIAIGSAAPVPTGCKCPPGERRRPSPSRHDGLGPLQTGDRRAMRLPTHRRQRLPPLQSGVGSAPSVFPAERSVLQRLNLRE